MGERFELKEIQKLEGHADRVWGLAWNPVATPAILASCSSDKTVRFWRQNPITSAFECMGTTGGVHTKTAKSCCWTRDGSLLAIASSDSTISTWDRSGNVWKPKFKLKKHKNGVVSVSFNASGDHLASASSDSVWIWECLQGAAFALDEDLEGHEDDVQMLQWHPLMENILFSCGCDDSIKVWKKDTNQDAWDCIQTLDSGDNGHSSTVWSISFNATGDKMVTSSDDLSIRVWGAERMQSGYGFGYGFGPWKHLQTLSGNHDQRIVSVHWSSDGIIASGAADGAICLYKENRDGLESEAMYKLLLKQEKAHEKNINSVQWSPKEIGVLASSSDDGTVKIWKLTTSRQ